MLLLLLDVVLLVRTFAKGVRDDADFRAVAGAVILALAGGTVF